MVVVGGISKQNYGLDWALIVEWGEDDQRSPKKKNTQGMQKGKNLHQKASLQKCTSGTDVCDCDHNSAPPRHRWCPSQPHSTTPSSSLERWTTIHLFYAALAGESYVQATCMDPIALALTVQWTLAYQTALLHCLWTNYADNFRRNAQTSAPVHQHTRSTHPNRPCGRLLAHPSHKTTNSVNNQYTH